MGCRCNDRAKLLGQAVRAATQMQPRRAAQRISLVARSAAGDMAAAQQRAQARMRALSPFKR